MQALRRCGPERREQFVCVLTNRDAAETLSLCLLTIFGGISRTEGGSAQVIPCGPPSAKFRYGRPVLLKILRLPAWPVLYRCALFVMADR